MHDARERLRGLAVDHHVQPDHVVFPVLEKLILHGRVSLAPRLQLVEEIRHNLAERDLVLQARSPLGQVGHVDELAPPLRGQLHQGPDVVRGGDELQINVRFLDPVPFSRIRKTRGVGAVHARLLHVVHVHLVHHAGGGGDEVEVILALQSLLHDFHVQQTEETAAKAESHRGGLLRLVAQRRVVDLQLTQRLAQIVVPVAVRGEQPAVHHGRRLGVPLQGFLCRFFGAGDGVAHARIRDGFDVTDEVPNLPRAQRGDRHLVRPHDPHLVHRRRGPGVHELDLVAHADGAVDDSKHAHHPAVRVKVRIEYQRPQGLVRGVRRRRHELHDLLQDVLHPYVGLGGGLHGLRGVQTQHVLNLSAHALRFRARKVDLVQHRDDLEVVLEGEIDVRHRLRLHPLARVHDEQRPLARG